MKVRDTEMGKEYAAMNREAAIARIAGCLFQGRENTFELIRKRLKLTAPTTWGVAEKVFENLMDFDPEVE